MYGTNGDTVDCIALVIQALDLMGIDNPGVKPTWYDMSAEIIGELNRYTERIAEPAYDGDIVVIAGSPPAFGLHGRAGFSSSTVNQCEWTEAGIAVGIRRCFRTRKT